jgi:hypothetical protein
MAKLKKYPKKPKASASVEVMKRYLERCKAVDKDNAPIKKALKEKEALKKKISNLKR